MAEGAALTFSDPDGYAAAFGDTRINLTITGAGDFKASADAAEIETSGGLSVLRKPAAHCLYLAAPRADIPVISGRYVISHMRWICFAKRRHGLAQSRRAHASTIER